MSPLLKQAEELIRSVENTSVSLDERRKNAIQLAEWMLKEALQSQTQAERREFKQIHDMLGDPKGKVFTTELADRALRSNDPKTIVRQVFNLIKRYGVPKYLPWYRRLQMHFFRRFARRAPTLFAPVLKYMLRQETAKVIIPAEPELLSRHFKHRQQEGVRLNLNHIGEAILGEREACRRLQVYLEDLKRPEIDYISVKISALYSQIELTDPKATLEVLRSRMRALYRGAIENPIKKADGTTVAKFVNFDMEEYRDLQLTVVLFRELLDEEEFFHFSAGIVLQAYLPDSYQMQKELTEWAMDRVAAGGAPIKIRLVKGANLAMEQVESSLHHWPQAPFSTKIEVDANYKRMMLYAFEPEHAQAVHIGIGSHNLFDIAFSLLLVAERGIREFVAYEMLEGMAEPMQRVVHALSGGMLLYCPVATEREFPYAVSYLVRRLDENSAPQNFLRHAFCLKVGSAEWDRQVAAFNKSCRQIERISSQPRRTQDRGCTPRHVEIHQPFQNEPETDWALPQNQRWISEVVKQWKNRVIDDVANGIGGKDSFDEKRASYGNNPSTGDNRLYRYALGSMEQLELALNTTQSAKAEWSRVPPGERARLLYELAQQLRLRRSEFLGAMMVSCGKTAVEADTEFNEAIDFVEYYRHNLLTHYQLEDVDWNPKGCVVVTPPWNFPVSIPTGGVAAALAAGNVVILKPAREAVLVARMLAEACWDAGIPKNVLQFFACDDEEVGSALIRDRRVDVVLLTGATATGELFLKMRPDLDLYAETGGKNTLIVTQTADRDLAIKAIVQSAFGHSGQKCSACSLLILEAELYDDMRFRAQLKDAVESLHVGSALDLKTRINPLILPPGDKLRRGLTELEPGQSWLLEPKQVGENPHLWSPGIKLGVTIGSDAYETEYFGPVLGVMRADDLQEALQIANTMVYGLTAGIISLDEKEQEWWLKRIEAGNCYINRGITGAIVERQPFGGTLASSFGRGAKAGGPNYLLQLMRPTQMALPHLQEVVNNAVSALEKWVVRTDLLDNHELSLLKKSLGNYAYYWKHYFSVKHDPQLLLGQDNLQTYRPDPLFFILQQGDSLCDQLRVIAAALTVGAPIHVHGAPELVERLGEVGQLCTSIHSRGTHEFIEILEAHIHPRVRTVTRPSEELFAALAGLPARILCEPVLANGRIELLNCLREVSISRDYHRYGNLGARESETRAQVVQT